MPYTQTNTFTTGTTLATNIRQEYQLARDYINGQVVLADIEDESIDTRAIVRGEYKPQVGDHQFTTGDMLGIQKSWQPIDAQFFTSHIKPLDQVAQAVYHDVGELGKRFYLQEPAAVFVQVYAWAAGDVNTVQPDGGDTSFIYLTTDDTRETDSLCCVYDDGFTAGGNRDQEGNAEARLFPIHISKLLDLSAGWHNVQVKVNPCLELSSVRARNIIIEVMYKN
jgi:hypothetical protein